MKKDDLRFVSLLGQNSVVDGTILYAPSHLKIAGTVSQDIECGGKLVIDKTGVVQGNIKADEMVLQGKFEGQLWIRNTLSITQTATLSGTVSAGKLKIDEGAHCQFDVSVDDDAEERFDRAKLAGERERNLKKIASKSRKESEADHKIEEKKEETTTESQQESDPADKSERSNLIDRFW